jgi:hypothetical protein
LIATVFWNTVVVLPERVEPLHHRREVRHVAAADEARRVGEPVRMPVVADRSSSAAELTAPHETTTSGAARAHLAVTSTSTRRPRAPRASVSRRARRRSSTA